MEILPQRQKVHHMRWYMNVVVISAIVYQECVPYFVCLVDALFLTTMPWKNNACGWQDDVTIMQILRLNQIDQGINKIVNQDDLIT